MGFDSNLDEGAHLIAAALLAGKVIQNYVRPPNLPIDSYLTELQNPYSFIVFNLVIWESGARYSFKVIWIPPLFIQSRFSFFYLTWETRHSTSRFSHSLLLAFDLFRSEINLSTTRSIMFHNTMEIIPNNASWMVMSILPSEASVGATLNWK